MFHGDSEKVALLSGVCVLAAFRSLADVISGRAVRKIWRKNQQALAEGARFPACRRDGAIAAQPKSAAAFFGRGETWAKNDLDRAIADYDEAIELDPKPISTPMIYAGTNPIDVAAGHEPASERDRLRLRL